jgi:hypothetical protein
MRFTLCITTKYIDRHPTTSMTSNPPMGNHPLQTTDNVNKAYILGHMNVLFSLVATAHLQP